jgi:hypothetical protein
MQCRSADLVLAPAWYWVEEQEGSRQDCSDLGLLDDERTLESGRLIRPVSPNRSLRLAVISWRKPASSAYVAQERGEDLMMGERRRVWLGDTKEAGGAVRLMSADAGCRSRPVTSKRLRRAE